MLEGDGTIESGRHAVEQLFMRDTLPTAFMCVNDQTAIGVMIGLGARGYDIPRDFSVTGFDDVPQAVFISPPLTTIRQPRTAIGKQAMALLLELLSDGLADRNGNPAAAGSGGSKLRLSPIAQLVETVNR